MNKTQALRASICQAIINGSDEARWATGHVAGNISNIADELQWLVEKILQDQAYDTYRSNVQYSAVMDVIMGYAW